MGADPVAWAREGSTGDARYHTAGGRYRRRGNEGLRGGVGWAGGRCRCRSGIAGPRTPEGGCRPRPGLQAAVCLSAADARTPGAAAGAGRSDFRPARPISFRRWMSSSTTSHNGTARATAAPIRAPIALPPLCRARLPPASPIRGDGQHGTCQSPMVAESAGCEARPRGIRARRPGTGPSARRVPGRPAGDRGIRRAGRCRPAPGAPGRWRCGPRAPPGSPGRLPPSTRRGSRPAAATPTPVPARSPAPR